MVLMDINFAIVSSNFSFGRSLLPFTKLARATDGSVQVKSVPLVYIARAVILFAVSVPVLSVHMVVAQPIVSHASRVLTKFWSFIILFEEKARASVTARGRPSGTATAKTVIATTMYSIRTSFGFSVPNANPLMQLTPRESKAAAVPAIPILFARASNFMNRGDWSSPSSPSPSASDAS